MQLLNCFAKSLKSWQKKYSVTGQVPLMVGIFTLGLIAYNSNLIQASEYKQQVKGQRIKLTLAVHSGEKEAWKELARMLGEKHKNIDLVIKEEQYDFKTAAQGSDIIYTDIIWLPEFVKNKVVQPIDNQMIRKFGVNNVNEFITKKGFLKSEIEHGKYPPTGDTRLYRIPFRTDAGLLYYRQDLLTEYGKSVPKTYGELIATANDIMSREKQKRPGRRFYGYLWQGLGEGSTTMFLEVLHGYGGFWIKDWEKDNAKKVGLQHKEGIDAIKFLRETLKKKISIGIGDSVSEDVTDRSFIEGDAVFLRSWANVWARSKSSESSVSDKIGFTAMVGKTSATKTSCQGGWGLAISRKLPKDKLDAAITAIDFLTSYQSQKEFTLRQGTLPTRQLLFTDPAIIGKYPHYPKLLGIINQYVVSRPRTLKYDDLSKILQNTLTSALDLTKDDKTVEGIMREGHRLTHNCLDEKKTTCITQGSLVKP